MGGGEGEGHGGGGGWNHLTDDAPSYKYITVVVHRGHPEAQHICTIRRLLLCILAPLR